MLEKRGRKEGEEEGRGEKEKKKERKIRVRLNLMSEESRLDHQKKENFQGRVEVLKG